MKNDVRARPIVGSNPEQAGYYTKEQVIKSGLPYWTGFRWINGDRFRQEMFLLTKSRCRTVGVPYKPGELPAAFRYCVAGPGPAKYAALYERKSIDWPLEGLFPHEHFCPEP